ncbi:PhnD/SsuA/transferrin family substrate-binding protein [Desulfococcaceae bacterium HSG9]|nr:PhnD/SsuA/transferrin family substrate-binding protein [Desulfococcaceae bacterium HSG9]
MKPFLFKLIFLALFLLNLASPEPLPAAVKEVKIGVLAKRGPEICLAKWSPTARYLTDKIPDRRFVIVPLDFEYIYNAVEAQEVDFILSNSSFYVELEHFYGANRIATLKNRIFNRNHTTFGGVIFCRRDRQDMRRLQDLKGKTFMAVKETSFGGWRMAWCQMLEKEIDPYKDFKALDFGGTHDAVVYAILKGVADAGTVRTDTLERMDAEGKIKIDDFYVFHEHDGEDVHLPFLHSTREYPEWPLARVKHTSAQLAEMVATALLQMPPDSEAARTALCGGWTIPLNYQPVHDCLKTLKVGPYRNLGRVTVADVIRNYGYWLLAVIILFIAMVIFSVSNLRLNKILKASHQQLQSQIEERKRAEQALQNAHDQLETHVQERTKALSLSEQKFRRIFEVSQDMIVATSEAGLILDINPAGYKMLGFKQIDPIAIPSTRFQDFLTEEDDWRAIGTALAARGFISSMEIKLKRNDGAVMRSLISGSIDRGLNGKIETLHFVVKDIERRKLMENQLAQADRLASIGQLASGIGHEINNPLGIILGYTQLLIRNEDPETESYADLKTIEKHVKNCQLIVNDLLNFARNSQPAKEPVNINDLIDDVLEFILHHSDSKTCEVLRRYDLKIPLVSLDEKKIKQVILNLVMNACHAVSDKGEIAITTGADSRADQVYIKVSDTGYGIESKNLTRIFDPFFTTKTTGEGTGLGLSVSYGIIKNHGGDIQASSRPGHGSTFTVRLPVTSPETGTS